MWMHFVEFCGTNPILGVGDAIEDNAASSQLVNRYTCRARLPVFVALAKGKHSQGDGEEEGRLSFALKEGHQHRGAGHHELLAPSFEDSRARYYSTPVRPSVEQQAPSLVFPLLVERSSPSPAGLPLGPSPSTVATDLEAMLSSSSSLNSPSLDWNCFSHFDERSKSLTNVSLRGSRSDRADRVDSSRGTFQNLSPKPEKEFLTALFSNGSLWQRSL